ncbi:hypothetical protein TrVGV298_007892 [Trichoderma virens]|nr:hypothetical protein TrVGV298_007892 [Trichoderma virens]
MIDTKALIIFFALFSSVWAIEAGDKSLNSKLTVAFFPESQGDSCQAKDISKAITLTTYTIPSAYTCFNMSDIFTMNSSTGFQMTQDQRFWKLKDHTNGIAWELFNQDLYDERANYTHTWLRMRKPTVNQDGKRSLWRYYQYTLPDCRDVRIGHEDSDDVPFSWVSCQTSEDGLCKSAAYPIGSFAIYNTGDEGDDYDCDNWTQFGAGGYGGNECWRPDHGAGAGCAGGGLRVYVTLESRRANCKNR